MVVPYMAATIETTWAMCADAFPDYELITYDRRDTGFGTESRPHAENVDRCRMILFAGPQNGRWKLRPIW